MSRQHELTVTGTEWRAALRPANVGAQGPAGDAQA